MPPWFGCIAGRGDTRQTWLPMGLGGEMDRASNCLLESSVIQAQKMVRGVQLSVDEIVSAIVNWGNHSQFAVTWSKR